MSTTRKKPKKSDGQAARVRAPRERKNADAAASTEEFTHAERSLHEQLGQRVRDARARRFMTRKQLAEQSGISIAYLARVESGTGNISLKLLHQLAHALNLPMASFLATDEPVSADFTMIVEFLKRQEPQRLADIRRLLFESHGARRVALVGIRGVGKSTVGPALAQRLGVPFVELNREIEKRAKLRIDEILSVYGQRGYRRLERECLDRIVADHPEVVLATGGGIVAEASTYEVLLASFFTLWLKATPKVMFERVLAQHDARIASPHMRREAVDNIAHTLEARRQMYELAHASYDTTGKTVDRVVRDLLELHHLAKREPGAEQGSEPSTVWGQS